MTPPANGEMTQISKTHESNIYAMDISLKHTHDFHVRRFHCIENGSSFAPKYATSTSYLQKDFAKAMDRELIKLICFFQNLFNISLKRRIE